VPRYLHDHGIARVVAPLPATAGTLWATVENYALILYPFVEGTTGLVHGMDPAQWMAYGAILRQIHATPVAPALAQLMRHETFVPAGAATVRDLAAHIGARSFDDPAARDLVAFWHDRQDTIRQVLEGAEDLGRRLAQAAPPIVLCHADIHTNNVLLDAGGALWIVDWDETVLAPKERDLMFAVGGGINRAVVGPRDEKLVLQGYGAAAIDPLALSYYRYAWAVNDIGDYGAAILFRPDLGPLTRRAAVGSFMTLFQPGRIVELALASDTGSVA
jgi:spectinomycin phosphotransferase